MQIVQPVQPVQPLQPMVMMIPATTVQFSQASNVETRQLMPSCCGMRCLGPGLLQHARDLSACSRFPSQSCSAWAPLFRSLPSIELQGTSRSQEHDPSWGVPYLGGCQNYGPFLGPCYNTAPIVWVPKRGP